MEVIVKKRSKILKFFTRIFRLWRNVSNESNGVYRATYRIVQIEKNLDGEYYIMVQVINKNLTFKAAPEELLADDKMVNSFSPTDIRNLTYLGYLGINSPKYKILAKRLSEDSEQMVFAVQKRGEKDYQLVTANEISKDENILHGLSQEDAHMVGMTTGNEQSIIEKQHKENLIKQLGETGDKK